MKKPVRPAIATWYQTESWWGTIEPVGVVSFTDKTATYLDEDKWPGKASLFSERRMDRVSDDHAIFPTFEEAKDWLVGKLTIKVASLQRQLDEKTGLLEKARQLSSS